MESLHDEIFTEMTFHAAYQPQRAVRTKRWKYIRQFHDYPHPVLANCDDSATKDILVEHGWGDQVIPKEQLYDLLFDPAEVSKRCRKIRRTLPSLNSSGGASTRG